MAEPVIEQGAAVTLHFSLSLQDGREVDSTYGKAPAQLVVGDGNLFHAIERRLLGLKAGDEREYALPPEDAFGRPNPANVQEFPRGTFAEDMALAPGLVVSFADARQTELPGVVKSVDDEQVVVDFNHPLSGKTLLFRVTILDVKPSEQIDHG